MTSDERIIQLETLVMHLQYDVEQLNAALLAQHVELKELREALARLERRMDAGAAGPEERDLEAERPPHY
jgi:SlyX protein